MMRTQASIGSVVAAGRVGSISSSSRPRAASAADARAARAAAEDACPADHQAAEDSGGAAPVPAADAAPTTFPERVIIAGAVKNNTLVHPT